MGIRWRSRLTRNPEVLRSWGATVTLGMMGRDRADLTIDEEEGEIFYIRGEHYRAGMAIDSDVTTATSLREAKKEALAIVKRWRQ